MRPKSELKSLEKSDIAVAGGLVLESCSKNPDTRSWKHPAEPHLRARMTGFREVALAKELGVCYASVCHVSNIGGGMQGGLAFIELDVSEQIIPHAEKLLIETIRSLPMMRTRAYMCAGALQSARFG